MGIYTTDEHGLNGMSTDVSVTLSVVEGSHVTDVSVTLSVVEGSHVRPPHALREMSRQARHDRYHSSENKNLCKSVLSVSSVVPDKLSFNAPSHLI